jgi:hypothetical protein
MPSPSRSAAGVCSPSREVRRISSRPVHRPDPRRLPRAAARRRLNVLTAPLATAAGFSLPTMRVAARDTSGPPMLLVPLHRRCESLPHARPRRASCRGSSRTHSPFRRRSLDTPRAPVPQFLHSKAIEDDEDPDNTVRWSQTGEEGEAFAKTPAGIRSGKQSAGSCSTDRNRTEGRLSQCRGSRAERDRPSMRSRPRTD